MFHNSRRKIVTFIMAILILFLLMTLCVIYITSYYEIKKQNTEMLRRYVNMYTLNAQPADKEKMPEKDMPGREAVPKEPPGEMDKPSPRKEHTYELSTFYSVAFSDRQETLSVDSGRNESQDPDSLVHIAKEFLATGKSEGKLEHFLYITERREGYTLVAFMDNTLTDNVLLAVLYRTLMAGSIAILLLFFLSVFLAYRIVEPLEENDKRQKRFLSDAGHELKTPVAVIRTNAELLSHEVGESEWLSNIQYENERMGKLVSQLLELSRAENHSVVMTTLDFSRLVMGEVLPFESMAYEKGLIISNRIEEDIHVEGNETQLSQLVGILLDNAISHAQGGKEISLTLRREHSIAVLTVENSGPEIPREQLNQLFERFYRTDESRNSAGEHYGLGLPIARAIAETHKGQIDVSCQDHKVIFQVSFPCLRRP